MQRPVVSENRPEQPAVGQRLYEAHCLQCHGPGGRGDGPAAIVLYPRPRDLTAGPFRLRSTQPGQAPSDDDLLAVIARGIPGSPMPGLVLPDPGQRAALLAYLRKLSPALHNPTPAPLAAGPPPAESAAAVRAGRAVFDRLGCAACHGADGRGDGARAGHLVDDARSALRPRDLVLGQYKGGTSPRDIYMRLTVGMDGTPMSALSDKDASPQERWQLAMYVASLARRGSAAASRVPIADTTEAAVVATRVDARQSLIDPLSAAWNGTSSVTVPLFELRTSAGRRVEVAVRAVYDDAGIAVRLDWADPTKSDDSTEHDFPDAAAIQLLAGAGETFVGMGGPDAPVTIWHWKADWQRQLDEAPVAPDAGFYPFPAFSAAQASNPHVSQGRRSPIEEGHARGLGTFTANPMARQLVAGRGVWAQRRWYVTFVRQRPKDGGSALPAKLAFALWDGARNERGGRKAISGWYPLVLEDAP